jgi:large subunit ribosomal protein L18
MARGAAYKVPRRRRREGKTNYYRRYRYIVSRAIRFVVRKTNKYIIAQVIKATPIGDVVIASAHSRELIKHFGWKAGAKNTPAAYLTGFLAGIRARYMGVEEAVLDIGLHTPTKGAKIFAAAKGAIDAGLKIPINEEMIPSLDRIRGETIAQYAQKLKSEDPEKYQRQFSSIIASGFSPEDLPELFDRVYKDIIQLANKIGIEVKVA